MKYSLTLFAIVTSLCIASCQTEKGNQVKPRLNKDGVIVPPPPPPPLQPPTPPPINVGTETPEPPPPPPPPPPTDMEGSGFIENMPRFPGCENFTDRSDKYQCAQERLLEYLHENVEYPPEAKANKITGLAVIQFVVEVDGSLSDINCVRDPGYGMGDAALAVAHQMNDDGIKWLPAVHKNRVTKCMYTIPVRFDD